MGGDIRVREGHEDVASKVGTGEAGDGLKCGVELWTDAIAEQSGQALPRRRDSTDECSLGLRQDRPQLGAQFSKRATHLALADIHESIAELRFYRERLFVPVA